MKNFLYQHWQRVIGGFMTVIVGLAIFAIWTIIDPNEASNYLRATADDFGRYRFRGHNER